MNKYEAIYQNIDRILSEKKHIIVAVDGRCASGKTTLAEELAKKYDANIFHADDFFLRPEQRTEERLSEAGGNFDRERFMEEVLLPLKEGVNFSYRKFSCKTRTLSDEIEVTKKSVNIVEGSYCQHPYFGDMYDLRIFLDIASEEQKKRILLRNPDKAERFLSEWIPMENRYFDFFRIKDKADIVLY